VPGPGRYLSIGPSSCPGRARAGRDIVDAWVVVAWGFLYNCRMPDCALTVWKRSKLCESLIVVSEVAVDLQITKAVAELF
jgi:hypothetical protein